MQQTQETQIQSLGREDLLEKEMATSSSIFAWRIPWTEKPGGLQSTGLQRLGHNYSDWARKHEEILKTSKQTTLNDHDDPWIISIICSPTDTVKTEWREPAYC